MEELEKVFAICNPGQTVILQHNGFITEESPKRIKEMLSMATEKTGVHFVVLAKGLDVVTIEN